MRFDTIAYSLMAMALYGAQHVLVQSATVAIANPLLTVAYAATTGLFAAGILLFFRTTRHTFVDIVRNSANWMVIVILVVTMALSATFYYVGIEQTPAAIVSSILNTTVFWGAVFAWVFRKQRPSKWLVPCLVPVLGGLIVQLGISDSGSSIHASTDLFYVCILVLVPALAVLRPYLSDMQLPSNDPIAVSLVSTVPYGMVGLAALCLLCLNSPLRVALVFSRAPIEAHVAFALGSCCFTLALALFQKALASASDKAAPSVFFAAIPSFTLLFGAFFGWMASNTDLAFAQQTQATSGQVVGGALVTMGLLAYAVAPKSSAAMR
jgi:drug/metabolite transporter (DMT)-like permease